MPLGKYKNFAACRKAKSKKYCAALFWKIHGKKEGIKILKHEIKKLKNELLEVINNDK